jgi:hypothetical protein
MTRFSWRGIVRAAAGFLIGFVCGGLFNKFGFDVLWNAHIAPKAVLYPDVATGLVLVGFAILQTRRRGLAFTEGLLLGIAFSIFAYWALIVWVVMGF